MYISESLLNWAKHRFQMENSPKYETGGAYGGGAYIEKLVDGISHFTVKVKIYVCTHFCRILL